MASGSDRVISFRRALIFRSSQIFGKMKAEDADHGTR